MKGINRNTLAIYIASFFTFQIYIAGSLLASMYAWFSDVNQNLIILLYSAPTLVSAILALALGSVIGRIQNKKMIVVLGLAAIVAGGVVIVTVGGTAFPLAFAGTILCGAGYSLVLNATNTMLVEMDPVNASTSVATNSAVGCLGGMIITSVAGFLAQDGVWTRAYLLCFPTAISLILFIVLFRNDKKVVQSTQQAAEAASQQVAAPAATRNVGLFAMVVLIFLISNMGTAAWNTNYATYVMAEKQIGTTVQTGLLATLASLGGVLGGFVVAGMIIPRLKNWTVPVCLVLVAAPCAAAAVGVSSMMVLYICAMVFMIFYQPVYGTLSAAAGKLLPGGGVSFLSAIMGLGGFVAPYILNFIGTFGDGTTHIKFVAGVCFLLAAALISIPIMKKANK